MLPSPRSSLSSFRDYYQHSSQNSVHKSDRLTIGFRNFQVRKILEQIDINIQEKKYWILFTSFRKILLYNRNQSNQTIASEKLKRIITKQNIKNPKNILKKYFLNQLMLNVKFQRQRQIQTMIKICIWFSKKQKQNVSKAFYKICRINPRNKQQSHTENTRYVKKLSKAMLCIIFRNLLHKKIKQNLQLIKSSQVNQISKSSIRFFKPKKGRQVYEHKVDEKIKKLDNIIHFFKIVSKKINRRTELFFERMKSFYQIDISNPQRDSLQMMTNAVRHLVYLTSKQTKSSEKQNHKILKVKSLKLQNLIKRLQRKSKRRVRQCIYHWRNITSQNNRHLGQQIERLLQLKQKMLEDI